MGFLATFGGLWCVGMVRVVGCVYGSILKSYIVL